MTPRHWWGCRLLALLAMGIPSACFVQGHDEPAAARITLALGGSTKGGPVAPGAPVDLEVRPCYVAASVTAVDLASPIRAAWACEPAEEPGGTVELSLEVPAGTDRELQVVVFLMEPEGLVTLTDFSRRDWAPGVVDLALTPAESPRGRIDGFVTGAEQDVEAVRLVDLDTGVWLPSAPATAAGGGFTFSVDRVPQGRFFGLLLSLGGGRTHEVLDCAVWATEATVTVVDVNVAEDRC